MKRVLDAIERIQAIVTNVFFVTTIVVVSFQVANRFVLKLPVLWTGDLAVVCFVWLGFLTASSAVRRYGHFRMSVLIDATWMPATARRALEIFSLLVILTVSAVLIVQGIAITTAGLNENAPGLGIRMAWAYAAVPVCAVTSLLFALEKAWEQLTGVAVAPGVELEGDVA
jgi:TRAP-type C4-dicarboxylate transport system permease small subunit